MIFEIKDGYPFNVGDRFTVAEAAFYRDYDINSYLRNRNEPNGAINTNRHNGFHEIGTVIKYLQDNIQNARFVIQSRKVSVPDLDPNYIIHDVDPLVDGKTLGMMQIDKLPFACLSAIIAQVREVPRVTTIKFERIVTLEIDDDNAAIAFKLNFPQYRKFENS